MKLKNLSTNVSAMLAILTIFSGSAVLGQQAVREHARLAGVADNYYQPGRIESAERLIAQADLIKLRASQFHSDAAQAIRGAASLTETANKLNTKLNLPPGSLEQYKGNLNAFTDHANQYRAHLAQVEQQLGSCHATEQEYRDHLSQYSLHTQTFHIPNIRPPHICGKMGVNEEETQKMANSMRQDMVRVAMSEQQLAAAEGRLQQGLDHNIGADAQLLHRSQLQEAEAKLAAEFASLRTEFELLSTQHKYLVDAGIRDPGAIAHSINVGTTKVSAKIK